MLFGFFLFYLSCDLKSRRQNLQFGTGTVTDWLQGCLVLGWLTPIPVKCAEPRRVEFLAPCRKSLWEQLCWSSAASPTVARAMLPKPCPSSSRAGGSVLVGWWLCWVPLRSHPHDMCQHPQLWDLCRWQSNAEVVFCCGSGWLPQGADKTGVSVNPGVLQLLGCELGFSQAVLLFRLCTEGLSQPKAALGFFVRISTLVTPKHVFIHHISGQHSKN